MSRAAALLLAALVVACRGDAPGDPPRLSPGRSACAACGMAVDEPRFAGGWVATDGESVLYDDAGELLAALGAEPARAAAAWVGDFETGRWVRAAEAVFVRAPGLATPMGSGVVAFASRSTAETFSRSRAGAEHIAFPGSAAR